MKKKLAKSIQESVMCMHKLSSCWKQKRNLSHRKYIFAYTQIFQKSMISLVYMEICKGKVIRINRKLSTFNMSTHKVTTYIKQEWH